MTLVLPIPTYARLPGQALQTSHDSAVLFPWSDPKDTTPDNTIRIHPGGSIVADGSNENTPSSMSTLKRKLDFEEQLDEPRPKRISPYLNTPKQRKEDRRKVLRISVQKLRQIDDPECFLRRSVLINNTLKKMQREIREEKLRGPFGWNLYNDNGALPRRRTHHDLTVLNNRYLASSAHLYDDFFVHPEHEKIDKITDCGPDVSAILEHSVVGYETTNCTSASSTSESTTSPRDANTQTPTGGLTNNDRQIVSEMDAVFNNIISAFSDLGDEVLKK